MKIVLAMQPQTGDMVRVTTRAEAEYHKTNGSKLLVMSGVANGDRAPSRVGEG